MSAPSLKRVFDVAAASVGLVVLAPAIIATGVTMAFNLKSKPLFLQKRVGRDGQAFTIFKIKTMSDAKDDDGNLLPEAQRTSRIGEIVRKTRLDELPQLLNVIKGDMSLVGPRPLSLRHEMAYDDVRTQVRPGLSGFAQIKGAAGLDRRHILWLDRKYVAEQKKRTPLKALFCDVAILARTLPALIRNRHLPHYRPLDTPAV